MLAFINEQFADWCGIESCTMYIRMYKKLNVFENLSNDRKLRNKHTGYYIELFDY